MLSKPLKNQNGIGIAAVLVIVALISVFALVGSQLVVSQFQSSRILQSQTAHNQLVRNLSVILKDPRAISVSSANATNPTMSACITGAVCNTTGSQYFNLYDGFGAGRLMVGDGTTQHTYFDIFGNACPAVTANCYFEAKAFYNASCPVAGSCYAGFEVSVSEASTLGALKSLIAFNYVSGTTPLVYHLPLVIGVSGTKVPVWADNLGHLVDSSISQPLYPLTDISIGNATTGSNINFAHHLFVSGTTPTPSTHVWGSMLGGSNFAVGQALTPCSGPACAQTVVKGQISSFGTTWYDNVSIARNMDVGNNTISSGGITVGGTLSALQFFYSSDENLKQNIRPIEEPLQKIKQLNPVAFQWKKSGRDDFGFIAQDVARHFPELVETREDGLQALKYGNILPVVLEAYKESRRITLGRLRESETKIKELSLAVAQMRDRRDNNRDQNRGPLEQTRGESNNKASSPNRDSSQNGAAQ